MRINPFRALRPAPEQAAQVASVPYDVVNRDEAARLAEGNAVSFLHIVRPDIDLPPETDPYADVIYAKARENLDRLAADGVLIREEMPCLYAYRQIMNGRSQVGIVCSCHVDDYEDNIIKKHEKTRQVKEDDRTRHVVTLNANTGPVFLTYRDEARVNEIVAQTMKTNPIYDFTAPDEVQHTVWRIENTDSLVDAFAAVPVAYVADGHHRSASAWRAGKDRRAANPNHTGNEEYNWFLTVLFPESELKILAYNRVVRDLNGLNADEVRAKLAAVGSLTETDNSVPDRPGSFGVYFEKQWYRLDLDEDSIDRSDPIGSLDVALLQERVLTPIFGIGDPRTDNRIDFVGGIRGTSELERRVDHGGCALAVSMFPTSIEQLMGVADAGEVMPPKSTWFEPKLRSGLLVHTLD